jgi:hypothetical protein
MMNMYLLMFLIYRALARSHLIVEIYKRLIMAFTSEFDMKLALSSAGVLSEIHIKGATLQRHPHT